jgi:hypothetical protein
MGPCCVLECYTASGKLSPFKICSHKTERRSTATDQLGVNVKNHEIPCQAPLSPKLPIDKDLQAKLIPRESLK